MDSKPDTYSGMILMEHNIRCCLSPLLKMGFLSIVRLVVFAVVLCAVGPAASSEWPMAEQFAEGTGKIVGRGGKQDIAHGIELVTRAAEAGNPEAQYAMGLLYRQGTVLRKNTARSTKWFRSAAEAGLPDAQAALGEVLLEKAGKKGDPSEGRSWLLRAVKHDHPRAHYQLGKSYLWRYPQEYEKALNHLSKAAKSGLADAQLELGIAYYYGGYAFRSRQPADYNKALYWIGLASDRGLPRAHTWMGYAYSAGHGVPQSDAKAVKYWLAAAKMNDVNAAQELAWAYREGRGVLRSRSKETIWLKRAAALGSKGAKNRLNSQTVYSKISKGELGMVILGGLIAIGIATAGSSGGSVGSNGQRSGGFMDMTDPMQFWGATLMMDIK